MAFGFPASYETQLDRLGSRHAAREATVYAFDLLGWKYEILSVDIFRATVPITPLGWGEIFVVSLETPDLVEIRSSCRYPLQFFDWGKNCRNVDEFLSHFSGKELRETMLPQSEPRYLDEAGNSPVDRLRHDR